MSDAEVLGPCLQGQICNYDTYYASMTLTMHVKSKMRAKASRKRPTTSNAHALSLNPIVDKTQPKPTHSAFAISDADSSHSAA